MIVGLPTGFAQERQDRPQAGDRPQAEQTQPAREGNIESKLALWLATCNNVQIEVSQLAAQKASDPAVKQFAQQMVQQHGQLNSQLAQFVSASDRARLQTGAAGALDRTRTPGQREQPGDAGARRPGEQPQTETPRQVERETQRGIERPTSRTGQDPFQEIASEASQKSSQMITSLLGEKQGHEFDMCYSGLQVFAHINFVAELEAMEGHGSQQFQQVVAKAAQTTQSHLETAKQLAEKVGQSGDTERVTRRPGQQGEQQERP
jgi:predicted outer membrane protein